MPLSIPNNDAWFPLRSGFPVADWDAVSAWVETNIGDDEQDLDVVWEQAWGHWMNRMLSALGEGYYSLEGENFYLLTRLPEDGANRLLDELEDRLGEADGLLGRLANPMDEGKMSVFVIDDLPRYRDYVAVFFGDPEQFVLDSGVFLEEGFPQFVLPHGRVEKLAATISRELAHYLLSHYKHLPTWLDEGIAQWVEGEMAQSVSSKFTDEQVAAHLTYWNAQTIQEFWEGASFRKPGEACALSYELALWLTAYLIEEAGLAATRVEKFITEAHADDAGEAAARQHLNISLGEALVPLLAATSATWQPNPSHWLRVNGAIRNGHKS